ncbi:MAG: hypothetical protein IBJ10_11890 [Phycisphaerales bacterium]|nr:hypothetical protein [Phycisphaerales bacterium]
MRQKGSPRVFSRVARSMRGARLPPPAAGRAGAGRRLLLGAPGALAPNPGPDLITARGADRNAQEDSVRIVWTGRGAATAAIVEDEPVDLTRQSNAGLVLAIDLRVDAAPSRPVTLGMECGPDCAGAVAIEGDLGPEFYLRRRSFGVKGTSVLLSPRAYF